LAGRPTQPVAESRHPWVRDCGLLAAAAPLPGRPPAEYGAVAALGDAAHGLAEAERRLAAQFEADISALGVPGEARTRSDDQRLHHLAVELRGETPAECRVLALLAYELASRGEGAETAALLAQRALRHDYLISDPFHSPALLAAGVALSLADRVQAAEAVFSATARRARLMRSTALYAVALGQRGAARYHRGALTEASADLARALDVADGEPWETMVWDGRGELLRIHLEQGQIGRAETDLERWGASGPLPNTAFGNRLRMARGHLHLARGRFAAACTDLETAGSRLEAGGAGLLPEWRSPAAIARNHLGQRDAALELARAELSLAEKWGAPRRLGLALTTLGLIEGGRQGVARLRVAVDALQETETRLQLAHAQVALGALLRRGGEPRKGRAALRTGLEMAASLGAAGLVGEAQQELSATAANRQRRTMLSGPAALTPSERRVAQLAAQGKSNPDIASALYVTRKTVEMHLMSAYRKLDINSRQQLQAALAA
jgi:DNA-binding CsgD family transcriptional regulator